MNIHTALIPLIRKTHRLEASAFHFYLPIFNADTNTDTNTHSQTQTQTQAHVHRIYIDWIHRHGQCHENSIDLFVLSPWFL